MQNFKTTYGIVIAVFAMLYTQPGFAQENNSEMDAYLNLNALSDTQKSIIQTERKKIKESREAFKKSLTKEQLNILKNPVLTKEEKRANLVASFTEMQKNLIVESETRIKGMAKRIKPTLSENQKKELKGLKQRYSKLKNGDSRGTRVNKEEFKNRNRKPKNFNNTDKIRTN